MSALHEDEPIDIEAIEARLRAQDAEKLQIERAMLARLAAMPPTFSYEEYLALCEEVGTPSGETGLFPKGLIYLVSMLWMFYPEYFLKLNLSILL